MMKSEFERLYQEYAPQKGPLEIDDVEYCIIEKVYNFYPGFGDKMEAVRMYDQYGIRIFKDLMKTTQEVIDLDDEIAAIKKTIREYEERVEKLKEIRAQRFGIY